MDFKTISFISEYGFVGFIPVKELMKDQSKIPFSKGVYMVLFIPNDTPKFLIRGSGGFFKGKDPNVSIENLKDNWVQDSKVIYIGKAGAEKSSSTLNSRLKQLLKFGQGKNVGHYGGRLIWQIEDYNDLIICWKELPEDDPREIEKSLISCFKKIYGKRPFANLVD